MPPKGPGEESNVLVLPRRDDVDQNESHTELKRRRTDTHEDLENVMELRPGIANRRKSEKPDLAKAKPSKQRKRSEKPATNPDFNGLTELEFSPSMPSIVGGKPGTKKLSSAQDGEVFADIRGAARLEKAISGVEFGDEPLSPEEVARQLLQLRDEDLKKHKFDRTFCDDYLLNTDEEVFMPIARLLVRMFRGTRYQNHLNDERVANLGTLVRDPDTVLNRLIPMLENYRHMPISNARQPAHNAPKGKGRALKPKKKL